MKVKYDSKTDVLCIKFSDDPIAESDEEKPGIIIDYSSAQTIVGIEILNASTKMPSPIKVEYEVA